MGKKKKRYFIIKGRYLYEFFDKNGLRQKLAHRKYDLVGSTVFKNPHSMVEITIQFPKPDEPISLIFSSSKECEVWFKFLEKGVIPPKNHYLSETNHQIKSNTYNALMEYIKHREPWFINMGTENLIEWGDFESFELLDAVKNLEYSSSISICKRAIKIENLLLTFCNEKKKSIYQKAGFKCANELEGILVPKAAIVIQKYIRRYLAKKFVKKMKSTN